MNKIFFEILLFLWDFYCFPLFGNNRTMGYSKIDKGTSSEVFLCYFWKPCIKTNILTNFGGSSIIFFMEIKGYVFLPILAIKSLDLEPKWSLAPQVKIGMVQILSYNLTFGACNHIVKKNCIPNILSSKETPPMSEVPQNSPCTVGLRKGKKGPPLKTNYTSHKPYVVSRRTKNHKIWSAVASRFNH